MNYELLTTVAVVRVTIPRGESYGGSAQVSDITMYVCACVRCAHACVRACVLYKYGCTHTPMYAVHRTEQRAHPYSQVGYSHRLLPISISYYYKNNHVTTNLGEL